MKIFKNFIGLAALALCLGFASCSSDDDAPSYSNVTVSNSELMTILKAKGYQFDENGKMLLDDKANSTTSLDLSGTKVDTAALKELSVFPNLKELNLSSNGYGPVFHIASLPSQITGLDLQGNDIYDFDGLVTAKVENDEVKATILHEFTKLYLPASCKYNVEDLMPFYTENEAENKTVDMQMVNDKGSLEKYNTLREIPDTYFRTFLKMKFASLFVDDTHIDISKPMGLNEIGESITLHYANQFADLDKIASISGIEYFINNPYYNSFFVSLGFDHVNEFNVGYLMPRANIKSISLKGVNFVNGIDLSKATGLASFILDGFKSVSELDLSNTLVGNQEITEFDKSIANGLCLFNSEDLESITFGKNIKGKALLMELVNLPNLKSIDLSSFKGFMEFFLLKLPNCQITYPNLEYVLGNDGDFFEKAIGEDAQISFLVSKDDVFAQESTISFINKFKDSLTDEEWFEYRKNGAFRWSRSI